MTIQAAKEELKSLTTSQRARHVATDSSDKIISSFYRAYIKSTWYSSATMRLKRSEDGNEYIYAVNNTFHLLEYTYLTFNLPTVRVRPEHRGKVRVAWCHNVGHNRIVEAVFKEDDDTYQTFDRVWLDINSQFYMGSGAGYRENYNEGVGNVPCLENFSECLPAYPINISQPWFYSLDSALAFPIFYKGTETRAEHRYIFKKKVSDLLRLQIRHNGKWIDTLKGHATYLELHPNAELPPPDLWGRYAYLSDAEVNWNKTCRTETTYYTRDIEICDVANPNRYNSTATLPLHTVNPCLAFFWVAENQDAALKHNFSNYTTNSDDVYEGWDPIKHSTLKYGTTVRWNKMPSHHHTVAEVRHFPSAPCDRGYHGKSYAQNSTNFHGDIGIVLADMKPTFECYIANGDIYLNGDDPLEEDNDEELSEMHSAVPSVDDSINLISRSDTVAGNSPAFITRSRLLVVRKFTIERDPKKEPNEKEAFKFTIV